MGKKLNHSVLICSQSFLLICVIITIILVLPLKSEKLYLNLNLTPANIPLPVLNIPTLHFAECIRIRTGAISS